MSAITPPNPALSTYLTASVRDPAEDRGVGREQVSTARDDAAVSKSEKPIEFKVENETLRDETESVSKSNAERQDTAKSAARGSYLDISV